MPLWHWQSDSKTSAVVLPSARANQKGNLVRPHPCSSQALRQPGGPKAYRQLRRGDWSFHLTNKKWTVSYFLSSTCCLFMCMCWVFLFSLSLSLSLSLFWSTDLCFVQKTSSSLGAHRYSEKAVDRPTPHPHPKGQPTVPYIRCWWMRVTQTAWHWPWQVVVSGIWTRGQKTLPLSLYIMSRFPNAGCT